MLLAACSLAGCAGPDGAGGTRTRTGETVGWPYWPTSMSIHPLTRLVTHADSGRTLIEARIEFLDRDGHTTRACGQLRLDVHDFSGDFLSGSIASWEMDLRDPVTNRRRYDDVTRTYLFLLEPKVGQLPEKPELRAYFLSADGRPLNEDKLRLRTE